MTEGLRRGALLEICIDLYRRHPGNGAGGCVACATRATPCVARRNCEKVLVAAGLDPAKFGGVNLAW
jgi:hypothetical protein